MAKKEKLIKKTSKTFLLTALVLTVISSIVLYFYTRSLLQDQVEESLRSTEARVVNAIKTNKVVFSVPPVTEIKISTVRRPESFKDTVIYDSSQDEMEAFRQLSSYEVVDGQLYQITVRNLVVESGDILVAIVVAILFIFILSFIFLFYFNTANNIKLWRPFFRNLEAMKKFSVSSNEILQLVESDILEFSELNHEIKALTSKVRNDYENLKQFTEDVSHEMQTPLAIIQAKIDNIINEQNISDKQFEQISSVQKDLQRLKHLNERITLLSKIDNNQFVNIENVNITGLIHEKAQNFKEMQIDYISVLNKEDLIIPMDVYLADILINNLISNAIKHGSDSRGIIVKTEKKMLTISNPGKTPLQHPDRLFLRFYREVHSVQSSGLGLAIVKKICDLYNFKLTYLFTENRHNFVVEINIDTDTTNEL